MQIRYTRIGRITIGAWSIFVLDRRIGIAKTGAIGPEDLQGHPVGVLEVLLKTLHDLGLDSPHLPIRISIDKRLRFVPIHGNGPLSLASYAAPGVGSLMLGNGNRYRCNEKKQKKSTIHTYKRMHCV